MSASPAQTVQSPDYPETRRVDHVETMHGVRIHDPYRWLEDLDADETKDWMRVQDNLTRSLIEPTPAREAILDRIRNVAPDQRLSAAQIIDDRMIYVKTFRDDDGEVRRQLTMRNRPDGTSRVIVNLADRFGPDARFAVYQSLGEPSFKVSPDGRYVAYGVMQGNSRWSRWYVHDLETGEALADSIDGINTSVFTTIWWRPDGTGFYYAPYDPTPENLTRRGRPAGSQRIYYHSLGTDQAEDLLIYDGPEDPDVTHWLWVAESHVVIRSTDGTESSIRLMPHGGRKGRTRVLVKKTEDTYSYVGPGETGMLFRTTAGAPNGKVVSIDPDRPAPQFWSTIIPEGTSTLRGAQLLGGRLLVEYRIDARPVYRIHHVSGDHQTDVDMPYIGWVQSGFVGREDQPLVAFTIQSAIDPGSLYMLDMRTGKTSLIESFTDTFDADRYVSEQVFYESRDGTRVPMFLFYRKDLERDGRRPVWLYAYGFNWSALPWYQVQHRMIVDMGGVYALANVRGGSEYGQSWVEAGSGVNRQNSIDDFTAAGDYLIDRGFTSSKRLIANGGSSSGPLAGAALTQRPDLFGAALISYPYLDMLRYEDFRITSTIHGTVDNPEEFRALLDWSPYHNVDETACYPPTLIAHGDEDQLALPLHSYKFTAALQHAQSCPNPVLLQIAWGRGHTVGGAEEKANQLAFLVEYLDLPDPEFDE